MAVLLVIGFITESGIENAWEAVERGQNLASFGADLHIYAGFGVIFLVAIRLLLRRIRGVPDAPGGEHTIVAMAARYMYMALYALMLLVPLSGMVVWYLGFGALSGLHELLFNGLVVLVLLHTWRLCFITTS